MFYVGPVLLRGKNGILQRSYVSGKIDDSMYFVRLLHGRQSWVNSIKNDLSKSDPNHATKTNLDDHLNKIRFV